MTDRFSQYEVLSIVSEGFEMVRVESESLLDDVLYEVNRRLKQDGHPFEFEAGPNGRVTVKETPRSGAGGAASDAPQSSAGPGQGRRLR